MHFRDPNRLSTLLLMIGATVILPSASGQDIPVVVGRGIVVESVAKGTEAYRAGLRTGDTLWSWSRGDAKGELETPFDLDFVETEQGCRGIVEIDGIRSGQRRHWNLAGDWSIPVRPRLAGSLLSISEEAEEL